MFQVTNLSFEYQDKPLLHQVNFKLEKGGLLHLKGANGVGKTTLLKLLAGLQEPTSGHIVYEGVDIYQNLTQYHQYMCLVGHQSGVNPYLTVRENCLFDLQYQQQELKALAAVFKLESHLETLCGLLSQGQRRQVGLLRLWMSEALLWLLDEPLVALDDISIATLLQQIEQHRQKGGMVILSSHQKIPLASEYQEYVL